MGQAGEKKYIVSVNAEMDCVFFYGFIIFYFLFLFWFMYSRLSSEMPSDCAFLGLLLQP